MRRRLASRSEEWISRIAGLEGEFLSGVELGRRKKISLGKENCDNVSAWLLLYFSGCLGALWKLAQSNLVYFLN